MIIRQQKELFVLRVFLPLFAMICASAVPAAESYPSRPVRLIVPFPAGGIADLSGRLIAEGLQEKFKQPFVVENKPGGQGVIGFHDMMKAAPDGYKSRRRWGPSARS